MQNDAAFLNYVMKKVQDSPEKFVAIIKSLSQQRACRLPKSIVAKCRKNSQLYHDIKCEEEREGCLSILKQCCDLVKVEEQKECRNFSKLCRHKTEGRRLEVCRDGYTFSHEKS